MNPTIVKDVTLDIKGLSELRSPILFIGGAYAGKSELAMKALDPARPALILGNASLNEPEFEPRIKQLKKLRPASWQTKEGWDELTSEVAAGSAEYPQLLIDSINMYLAHVLVVRGQSYSSQQLGDLVDLEIRNFNQCLTDHMAKAKTRIALVTSEVGAGVAPPRATARFFRESLGIWNQKLAALCPTVITVTAGIPQLIKSI
jgi:adenosylcobinamide kinase/adenosylcobinamide-phosphate guanylyltransferase